MTDLQGILNGHASYGGHDVTNSIGTVSSSYSINGEFYQSNSFPGINDLSVGFSFVDIFNDARTLDLYVFTDTWIIPKNGDLSFPGHKLDSSHGINYPDAARPFLNIYNAGDAILYTYKLIISNVYNPTNNTSGSQILYRDSDEHKLPPNDSPTDSNGNGWFTFVNKIDPPLNDELTGGTYDTRVSQGISMDYEPEIDVTVQDFNCYGVLATQFVLKNYLSGSTDLSVVESSPGQNHNP